MNLMAHLGVHHKTAFEAVMHVVSQIMFITMAGVLVALAVLWLVSQRTKAQTVRQEDKDQSEL